jgi:glutathione S-transferase
VRQVPAGRSVPARPAQPLRRGTLDGLAQQTTLNGAGREAFIQLVRTPQHRRDAQAIAASQAATEPLLALLDAHLARHAFMAGERATLADIPIACEMHRWWGLPLRHAEHAHLRRWYDGLRERPAARGVLDLALS